MDLNKKLEGRKAAIAEQWLGQVLDTYPKRTAGIWKKEKNRFANPVGHTLATETRAIVDILLDGGDVRETASHLEPIVKVRCIQEFTPAQSLSFVYLLKGIVRAQLGEETKDPVILEALSHFDKKIDHLALLAFDIYTGCRDRICELRVNEVKRSVSSLLRRAKLIVDDEPEPDVPAEDNGAPPVP